MNVTHMNDNGDDDGEYVHTHMGLIKSVPSQFTSLFSSPCDCFFCALSEFSSDMAIAATHNALPVLFKHILFLRENHVICIEF
jgi:hypothetical protein